MVVKRRCIITHQILDRKELFKVVRSKEGNVSIDLSYNKQGRSAYIIKDLEAITKAKKKDLLSRALHHKVEESIYEELIKLVKGE